MKTSTNFVVYIAINKINYTCYIGYTNNFKRRKIEHKSQALNNSKCYIHNAIRKYGILNFIFDIIEICDTEIQVKEAEIFYIEYFKSLGIKLYNLTNGDEGVTMLIPSRQATKKTTKGHKLSKEHKYKISQSLKGRRPWNKDTKTPQKVKEKISLATQGKNNPMFGKHHSIETKQKISNAHIGMTYSDETKAKMSLNRSGKKNPNYGKHLSENAKNKISLANTGKRLGEQHPRAKFTQLEADQIRQEHRFGLSRKNLSKKYNVSKSVIDRIITYKTYI